jgi:hypothetical protein
MADFKNGIANIVEHKYGANGNEHTALEQSTLYKQYFEGQISSDRIKRILFLGIHFKSVGTVHEGPMEVHLTHFLLKVLFIQIEQAISIYCSKLLGE